MGIAHSSEVNRQGKKKGVYNSNKVIIYIIHLFIWAEDYIDFYS